MIRQISRSRHFATALALASLLLVSLVLQRHAHVALAAPPLAIQLPRASDIARARLHEGLDWTRVQKDGDGYVQVFADGAHAELSLDPRLQALAEKTLADHPTLYGAAVLLSVDDGRVLAMAGRSDAEPELDTADLVLKPWAPAASVFKVVTASALVESGLGADERVCYHGGVHSVEASNLAFSKLDDSCNSLAFAVAKSQNAIIARLAHDHLTPEQLEDKARKFGFGKAIDVDFPVVASAIDVPHDPLEYARASAGFWHSTLSPLHGAVIAATIARGGTTPPVKLVSRIVDAEGSIIELDGAASQRVISPEVASVVGNMMVGTTEFGTARLGFHDKHGKKVLPGISVAGKTGSLNRATPFLSYSWFVGYAPADKPRVAFAVLLGNGANWRWKAHQVAADLLSGYFKSREDVPTVSAAVAAR
jgi:peptidoglycan glycosyltransferase